MVGKFATAGATAGEAAGMSKGGNLPVGTGTGTDISDGTLGG